MSVTAARLDAASRFAETWAELLMALPDDYDCHMTCTEADAAAALLSAFGDEGAAQQVLAGHAAHDDEGDAHYQGERSTR